MTFKLPKNLFPVALTLCLVAPATALAKGPVNPATTPASGNEGPLYAQDYPGISSEMKKGIANANMMFRAAETALNLARRGQCRAATYHLIVTNNNRHIIDEERVKETGNEAEETPCRIATDMYQYTQRMNAQIIQMRMICGQQ